MGKATNSELKRVDAFMLLALLFFLSTTVLAQEKIKVGVLAAYSGEWGAYGTAYRRGIELAAAGDKIDFIYEDDGFDPARSVSAFRKLSDIDGISAAIVGDTVTALALAPIAEAKNIPLLVWATDDSRLRDKKLIFRLWPSFKDDVEASLQVLRSYSETGKISLYVSAHSYSSAWGEAHASALGKRLQALEEFPADPRDYRSYIIREKARGTKMIGLCLNAGQNGLFAAQMKQLGISIPLFACSFIESSADLEQARGALDGAWCIGTAIDPRFLQRYEKEFGTTNHLFSAAVHYDAARALAAALEKPGKESLAYKLSALGSFIGAHGKVSLVVSPFDRYFDIPLRKYRVILGQLRPAVD